ncbi:MAG: S8 family serine peptidase, partial [Thermomicrobiales bacterium]
MTVRTWKQSPLNWALRGFALIAIVAIAVGSLVPSFSVRAFDGGVPLTPTPETTPAADQISRDSEVITPDGKIIPDGFRSNQMIIRVKKDADPAVVAARWGVQVLGWIPEVRLALLGLVDVPDTRIMLDPVSKDPDIDIVEINSINKAPEARSSVNFSTQLPTGISPDYGYPLTGASATTCVDGSGITVAVVDTGIDLNHPDFAGKISPDAYNVIDHNTDTSETANGIDDDGDGMVDEMYGHGTHVAGIVSRVAPGATILPIKALNDEGVGDAYALAEALVYATEHGANIINLSLSSPVDSEAVQVGISYAEAAGVVIVAATGNDNTDSPKQYPAATSGVIGVAATGPDDVKSPFSNYGSDISISAPGTDIESALPGDTYGVASGTSMAAPFVTGGIALLMQKEPSLTAEAIRAIVVQTATSINEENPDYEGEL